MRVIGHAPGLKDLLGGAASMVPARRSTGVGAVAARGRRCRPGPGAPQGSGVTDGLGRVLVIIPTYDERDNLRPIAERLFAAVPTADLLVVDDDSPDGTGDVADALRREPGLADGRLEMREVRRHVRGVLVRIDRPA